MNRASSNGRAGNARRVTLVFFAALVFAAAGTGALGVGVASASLRGLATGFANAPLLTFAGQPARNHWLGKAEGDGAGFVRVPFTWQAVAPRHRPAGFVASNPASPGYSWGALDSAVRGIASHRMRVLLMPYLAPIWAQDGRTPPGVRPGSWKPDARQFGDFARALAVRYSGHYPDPGHHGHFLPRVAYYQAWNEPNLAYDISPAWKKTRSGWVPVSPGVYRPMLNAFYSAVKSIHRSNVVLAGGTAPYGDSRPVGSNPKLWRVRPLAFYRALFCLNKRLKKVCGARVHLSAVDNHPYTFGSPTKRPYYSDDVNISDMYKIRRVLSAGLRAGTVLPAGPKALWADEISWATNPPVPNHIAVSPARQAAYAEKSMYLLWRQHVSTVMWLDIRDMPSSLKPYDPFYFGGLYFHSGAPKPMVIAFRFPFVTRRLSSTKVQAWGRSPTGGTLRIERRVGQKWVVLTRLRLSRHQVFLKTLRAHGPGLFRAQVGRATSLAWSQPG